MSYNHNYYTVFTGPIIFFRWQFFQLYALLMVPFFTCCAFNHVVKTFWHVAAIWHRKVIQSLALEKLLDVYT